MEEKQDKPKLPFDEMKKEDYQKFFGHPATKVVLGAAGLLVFMYSSKYFLNAGADMIRAYKRFRGAVKS